MSESNKEKLMSALNKYKMTKIAEDESAKDKPSEYSQFMREAGKNLKGTFSNPYTWAAVGGLGLTAGLVGRYYSSQLKKDYESEKERRARLNKKTLSPAIFTALSAALGASAISIFNTDLPEAKA